MGQANRNPEVLAAQFPSSISKLPSTITISSDIKYSAEKGTSSTVFDKKV